jgi:hypothetical protein
MRVMFYLHIVLNITVVVHLPRLPIRGSHVAPGTSGINDWIVAWSTIC